MADAKAPGDHWRVVSPNAVHASEFAKSEEPDSTKCGFFCDWIEHTTGTKAGSYPDVQSLLSRKT